MKTCPTCLSTAFDDMPVCFGCLRPFDQTEQQHIYPLVLMDNSNTDPEAYIFDSTDDDLIIEEPPEITTTNHRVYIPVREARFHVMVPELFGYDIYMRKEEGAELTVGCARDNNIVLPHTESRRHPLRLYYSQGEIWAQDRESMQKAQIGDMPLTGTCCLKQGAVLQVGEARIELIAE